MQLTVLCNWIQSPQDKMICLGSDRNTAIT